MKWMMTAGILILAACGGKGPQYIREPQVKNCTCEKCVCAHCCRENGAICYCGDKNAEQKPACACGKGQKTCHCDHCVGYQQAPCTCGQK
jgi:hypothetical protein